MDLHFDLSLVNTFKSEPQKIRVMSEAWTRREIVCPSCTQPITGAASNSKAHDFDCIACAINFEQKSKFGSFGTKVIDGSYQTMYDRIRTDESPHFFFLNYSKPDYKVTDFFVVPSFQFPLTAIKKRPALKPSAQRAGWVGCFFLMNQIPQNSRINYLKDSQLSSKDQIAEKWSLSKKLFFNKKIETKSWLQDVLACVNEIKTNSFSLSDLYVFENKLKRLHPENNNIKAKIRQQLQLLRDSDFIQFLGVGKYTKNQTIFGVNA